MDTELLAKCGHSSCPNCDGTGVAKGYGMAGQQCPCVSTCGYCDAPLPCDDEHYDEGRPIRYDGLPACPKCRAQFEAEDAQVDPQVLPA
jgi:hypothetical protein